MEADMYCKSQRSYLPVISSEKDSFLLREYMQQHSPFSFWLNLERSNDQHQWRDGSLLHFTRWISGEPRNNTTANNRNCTVVFKKGWKTENCLECHNTVCQKGIVFYW